MKGGDFLNYSGCNSNFKFVVVLVLASEFHDSICKVI